MKIAAFLNKEKGYTVLELVAILAITAVLVAIVVYGIGLAQKKARDIDRNDTLNSIKVAISDFQTKTGRVPDPTQINWSNPNSVIVGYGTQYAKTINLKGPSVIKAVNSTSAETLGDSDSKGTIYYYWVLSDGYVLAADREDGVANVGSSRTKFGNGR